MRKNIPSSTLKIFIIAAFAVFIGCGGGGSSGGSSSGGSGNNGTVSALTVAEQVSVVDAQEESGGASALKIGKILLSPSDIPADSDYYNDHQEVYVEERSAKAFGIINEILCAMAQARYDDMLNKGNYKAQIDMNKCRQDSDDASTAGQDSQDQSSGSTAPDYEMWTVNSSRTDNSSPHIVKVWIHEEAQHEEPAKVIYVKAVITEGKSDTNPYGLFVMNFKAHPEVDGVVDTGITVFTGFLKTEQDSDTGEILLKFAISGGFGEGAFSFDERVVLNRSVDGSSGSGSAYNSDTWDGNEDTSSYNMAFNTTHFFRADAPDNTDQMCFSRTSFEETPWDYGLYSASGSRVNRRSGFSIKKDDAYGWIGYYGLWLPDGTELDDGDTVYRVTYEQDGETTTPYTVVKKGGRLKKYVRNTTTLGAIKNIPLDWFDMGNNSRVKWTGSQFVKFAVQNPETYMWEDLETPTPLDLSALDFGELNFWSQSMGGQVRIKLNCTRSMETGKFSCDDPINDTQVIFFREDMVFPGDIVPSTLRCYDNCPKYNAEAGGIAPADPYYSPDYDPSDGATYYSYNFSSSADGMILKDDSSNSLLWTDDGSGQSAWGIMSGPLFDPTEENLDLLACDDWNGDGQPNEGTCGWKAWGVLSEYYTWETGDNSWNTFTALATSGGSVLRFEAPLQVQYTHSQSDPSAKDYKYDGVTFYLEYSGFGNLWGIPGTCIDMDTGEPVSCGPDTRWVPELGIPDGSDVTDGTNDYLVKALRKEQRMSNVDLSNCASLELTSYTLPSIDDWVNPDIGDEPEVNNAPAVIGGVLQ